MCSTESGYMYAILSSISPTSAVSDALFFPRICMSILSADANSSYTATVVYPSLSMVPVGVPPAIVVSCARVTFRKFGTLVSSTHVR